MNQTIKLRLLAAVSILLAGLILSFGTGTGDAVAQEDGASTPAAQASNADESSAAADTTDADAPEADGASTPADETATDEPTTEEPTASEPDREETKASDEASVADESADAAEVETNIEIDIEADPDEGTVTGSATIPAGPAPAAGAGAAAPPAPASTSVSAWIMTAVILALFILPSIIGSSLGKTLGMPDHGWKIALAIGTIAAGGLAIVFAVSREMDDNPETRGFKLGPDLGGGVTLIYDLADPKLVVDDDGEPADPDTEQDQNRRSSFRMDDLLGALKQRVDPSGTKEVTIRTRGKSVEIIIPRAGQAELDNIKKLITELGQLEFRILVDRTRTEFEDVVDKAESLPPGQTLVTIGGVPRARWVPYDVEEFGPLDGTGTFTDRDAAIVKRMGVHAPEILVKIDPYNVTGEYLTSASAGVGMDGHEVRFTFDSQGANRFGKLTGEHLPNPGPYYLGIILDENLRSAPIIKSRISRQGQISGAGMTEEEVNRTAEILDAGSLPAELNKIPVSEAQTGPEIGMVTIEQGKRAMLGSMAIVLLFILFYYRFAGIVACLALVCNMVLVIGAMVLLNAAFTLPGIAGLVLTVGMSVDANVLIFERIREELSRGATLRMAIRNGFGRATTTIVDANVTTLITATVLWVIGSDQIRGFATTLWLGILMSMYTAIFCSRILFDIAERKGWITKLGMMQLLSRTNINFMSKWPVATFLSLVIIGLGMFGVVSRQSNLLNIDFTGGTSVTMVLKEPMEIGDVRDNLLETELADKNLLVVARNQDGTAGTTYKVDCNVLDEVDPETGEPVSNAVDRVEGIIAEAFGDKLETYTITADEITPFAEGEEGENQFTGFETSLQFGDETADESVVGVSHDTLMSEVRAVLDGMGRSGINPIVTNPNYTDGSSRRFRDWNVQVSGLDESEVRQVIDTLLSNINGQPIFPLANKIGGRVAGDMQLQAIYAILVSLVGIIGYIWIRFQKISYGLAAVVALVHDVLVTLGVLALSAYVVQYATPLAVALQIDTFQISLPIVAAFLTIIGYSLNDTIVVFDRIREVRGKSPTLTADMINTSVNQTLSRTLLTSLTTLIVVVILYFFGGDGIHAFAFALVIGVIVGTYSSIFIASPALLWLSKQEQKWAV